MSINTRFMPDEEIEAEARSLLAGYARKAGTAIAVPALLLDDLLQHLGLQFEIYDLRKELKTPDVLGAIYLEQKLIRIDETLDPDVHPAMRDGSTSATRTRSAIGACTAAMPSCGR